MMTSTGVDRARAVRRLPENKQTDKELLLSATGLPWAMRTAPERSRRRRVPRQAATEIPSADAQQQQAAGQQAGPPEGGAAAAPPQAEPQAQPPSAAGGAAAAPPQPAPQPVPPAAGDVAMGAPSQAARREVSPAAEVSEGKRARVAAIHALDVGNLDDSPDAFWEDISDEVEDPTENGMFDVDAEDELDKQLTQEHLQRPLDHGVGEDIPKSEAKGM